MLLEEAKEALIEAVVRFPNVGRTDDMEIFFCQGVDEGLLQTAL